MFVDIFIGKLYAFIQVSMAINLTICSGIVASGIQCNNSGKYAVAVFILFGSVASVSGVWGSRMLAKAVEQLKVENVKYEDNNRNHEEINKESRRELEEMKKENNFLKENIAELENLREQTAEQIEKLSAETARITSINSSLILSNQQLTDETGKLSSQTKKLQQLITMAENNREIMEKQLRDLMKSLADNGDNFVNFNDILKENMEKSTGVAEMMDALLSKLGNSQFSNIDADGNGVITKQELMNWAEKEKNNN